MLNIPTVKTRDAPNENSWPKPNKMKHWAEGRIPIVTKFVDREEGGGNRRTFKKFNNKSTTQSKAAAPHGRLPHTTQIKNPGLVLSPLPLSSLLLLSFRSSSVGLETGEWRRCRSLSLTPPPRSVPTALGPAPLVTYPHRPSQAGGYPLDCALLPPPPRGPVRAAAAYLGVRTDEAREKETEG